ncbi:MAG: SRPBCC family protein [Rhizobiales bacterium]|nr:SRPBCC family protein [Hyphomicrobiales bacterium]
MTDRSVLHATFAVSRLYPAAPARVFQAFADPAIKRRWFIEADGWTIDEYTVDFAEGGRERSRFRFGDGPPMASDAVYHEIVPDRRIVYSYAMTVEGKRISVSLATIAIAADGTGTRLVYTEQAAFLDGADVPANRETGWRELLDMLALELDRQTAAA